MALAKSPGEAMRAPVDHHTDELAACLFETQIHRRDRRRRGHFDVEHAHVGHKTGALLEIKRCGGAVVNDDDLHFARHGYRVDMPMRAKKIVRGISRCML